MISKPLLSSCITACLAVSWPPAILSGAETLHLTLPEAVNLALRQNRALKIARLKVAENQQKQVGARSNYFPEIRNQSSFLHTTSVENINIPAGALGVIPNVGLIPSHALLIDQGNQTFELIGTTLVQPLTQLIRIRQANRIAASEVAASRDELKKAEDEVALGVHELYFGVLIAQIQVRAAEEDRASSATRLHESEEDVRNGSALKISAIESHAGLLLSEQSVLASTLRLSDLATDLNDVLGLPLDTRLELSTEAPANVELGPREEYTRIALAGNPQILAAMEVVEKAKAGVKAAKSSYIPDVSAFARQSYQNGVPFLVHNFGTFGLTLTYDVFDFGKRRATVREREAQLAQATENVERLKDTVNAQIERSYNKVERTNNMLQVANEMVKLRQEGERLAENQVAQGAALASARRQAFAASYKAQADLLQAQLAHLLARAELEQVSGRTPGVN